MRTLVLAALLALVPPSAVAAPPDGVRRDVAVRSATAHTEIGAARVARPAAGALSPRKGRVRRGDPRTRQPLFADPSTLAARQGAAYRALAATPQALWVTSEVAAAQVAGLVRSYVSRATRARRTPVLAVYGIPARDCGLYSAGGAPDAGTYRAWVGRIARALRGSRPLVVLEPDALASLGACDGQGDRIGMLRWAGQKLTKAGAWVYLDAGHSAWQPADVMAQRLVAAGVARLRGFSLDVANYRPLPELQAYAGALRSALADRGVRDRHYVLDTSRNGSASPVTGDWCNPTWARIGTAPRMVFRGAFDGSLWVKHPGESDGSCGGAPSAGTWCDRLADGLLGRNPAATGC